jgi:hypothetical protein
MQYELLKELIEANRERLNFAVFGNGSQAEWIEHAQKKLDAKFPPSFIWWLSNYKGGEINGDEIFGVYNPEFSNIPSGDIVYVNQLSRKNGWSTKKQLLIQKNDQGETYYVDLSRPDDEHECPIIVDPPGTQYASNFLDFLEKKIRE